jgi:hypothetical protein
MDPNKPESIPSVEEDDDSEDNDVMLDGYGAINVGGFDSSMSPTHVIPIPTLSKQKNSFVAAEDLRKRRT